LENWQNEFCGAITICDEKAKIIYMNKKSELTFLDYGGADLIGQNLLDCHNPDSKEQILSMMKNEEVNAYTIEKNGVKKLIYQAPWYENGEYKGFLELSLEIPFIMSHFVRE